jgi:CRP/FNR family cyclic AMP-dependent transcriptional regulator
MDDSKIFQTIRKSEVFADLTDNQLKIIQPKLHLREVPKDQIIIEQEAQTFEAYIIVSGSVRIYRTTENGDEITLTFRGLGEIIGEMALLDNQPRSASVETIQPTQLLIITKENFRQVIFQFPEIALNLLKTLTKRLRQANLHLEEERSQNLAARTWKILETLANYFPDQEITMSQEELANIIGATRARVTEVLDQFESEGKITLSHRKIHLN